MGEKVVIIGAGALAREVVDIYEARTRVGQQEEVAGYIVDPEYGSPGTIINGKPILGGFDWLKEHAHEVRLICAVGAPEHRIRLVRRAEACGARFTNAIHPAAVLSRWVTLGSDIIIAPGAAVSCQVVIHDHVQINFNVTIGHDVTLREFVTVAPGAHVSGNVSIGAGSYVGTGADIIQKVTVGEWAIIGAGSAVFRDVPANSTVVGVPGRVVMKREPGWHLISESPISIIQPPTPDEKSN